MLELLTNQKESNHQFRRWKDILVSGSTVTADGWVIQGRGVAFTNCRWGTPDELEKEVMLCIDTAFGSGIVKIVQPETNAGDNGKLTAIAYEDGRHFLLRQGRLQKNRLSRTIKADFASLTGLNSVPVSVAGIRSSKAWYVVACLADPPQKIIEATTEFVLACARARSQAGGGTIRAAEEEGYGFGLDEQENIVKVKHPGWSKEVTLMQGYVWQALKKIARNKLTKPKKNGFEVDCFIESKGLLIEIKTGVAAHNIYEAVGQLKLYPSLIGLVPSVIPVFLLPDQPLLKPAMAAAIHAAGIKVYTYSIGVTGKKPKITFSKEFCLLCGL